MAKGKVTRGGNGEGQHEDFVVSGANLPANGDYALVGDGSDAGQVDIDVSDEEKNWDLPEGATPAPRRPDANGGGVLGGDEQTRDQGGEFNEEDSRLAYSDDNESGAAPQERRTKRQSRNALRRERAGAAQAEIQGLRQQLEELGGVVRTLATGQGSLAVNTIEGQMSSLQNSLRIADDEMANAVKNSDGDTYARAQKIRDEIVGRLYSLQAQHGRLASSVAQQGQADGGQVERRAPQQQQQQVDPRIVQMVEDRFDRFCDRFPWFDSESQDANSNIVRAIDRELATDGYQRHTPAFWQSMERRLADYGFHANREVDAEGAEGAGEIQQQTRQRAAMERPLQRPPTSTGRSTQSRGGFHLSEVQTGILRDEGLLEDKLSDSDIAKRDRILAKWRQGQNGARRQGAR